MGLRPHSAHDRGSHETKSQAWSSGTGEVENDPKVETSRAGRGCSQIKLVLWRETSRRPGFPKLQLAQQVSVTGVTLTGEEVQPVWRHLCGHAQQPPQEHQLQLDRLSPVLCPGATAKTQDGRSQQIQGSPIAETPCAPVLGPALATAAEPTIS